MAVVCLLKYNLTILVLWNTERTHSPLGRYDRSRVCPPHSEILDLPLYVT